MPDYSKGKIYCIRSPNTNKVYIGSTIQPLSKRMGCHRGQYKMYLDNRHHLCSSFKILEAGDEYIELIENHPCKNKEELCRREGEIQRETENCVNRCIAGRTEEEIKEFYKNYYEKNKEKILKNRKEYYTTNNEKLLENQKEYREKNKDKINEQYTCDCGSILYKRGKARHEKTKKHLKWVESQK